MLTLANAGTQSLLLLLLRTALTATVCTTALTWLGTSKKKPLSADVHTQLPLPLLQRAGLAAVAALADSVAEPAFM